jgi:hypothetical protein
MIYNYKLKAISPETSNQYNNIQARLDLLWKEINYQQYYWQKHLAEYNQYHQKDYEKILLEYELLKILSDFYEY